MLKLSRYQFPYVKKHISDPNFYIFLLKIDDIIIIIIIILIVIKNHVRRAAGRGYSYFHL